MNYHKFSLLLILYFITLKVFTQENINETNWNTIITVIKENCAINRTYEATTFEHDNVYYYNRGFSIYAIHDFGQYYLPGQKLLNCSKTTKSELLKLGQIA